MPLIYLNISGQALSEIHAVGLCAILMSPYGPANKYLHYLSSIIYAPCNILTQSINENNSLCLSNNDLQIFSYNE